MKTTDFLKPGPCPIVIRLGQAAADDLGNVDYRVTVLRVGETRFTPGVRIEATFVDDDEVWFNYLVPGTEMGDHVEGFIADKMRVLRDGKAKS